MIVDSAFVIYDLPQCVIREFKKGPEFEIIGIWQMLRIVLYYFVFEHDQFS